jgi:hypothetical protein
MNRLLWRLQRIMESACLVFCDCNCGCKEVVLFCAFTMGIIVVQVPPMIVASNVIVTLSVLVFIKLPDNVSYLNDKFTR